MKIGYLNHDAIQYKDFNGKIDIFVPCKPLRALFTFKDTTSNCWIVCDYLTGLKLGSYATKKAAKINAFTVEMSIQTEIALKFYEKRNKVIVPELNTLP